MHSLWQTSEHAACRERESRWCWLCGRVEVARVGCTNRGERERERERESKKHGREEDEFADSEHAAETFFFRVLSENPKTRTRTPHIPWCFGNQLALSTDRQTDRPTVHRTPHHQHSSPHPTTHHHMLLGGYATSLSGDEQAEMATSQAAAPPPLDHCSQHCSRHPHAVSHSAHHSTTAYHTRPLTPAGNAATSQARTHSHSHSPSPSPRLIFPSSPAAALLHSSFSVHSSLSAHSHSSANVSTSANPNPNPNPNSPSHTLSHRPRRHSSSDIHPLSSSSSSSLPFSHLPASLHSFLSGPALSFSPRQLKVCSVTFILIACGLSHLVCYRTKSVVLFS
jgi:hypothetical protein